MSETPPSPPPEAPPVEAAPVEAPPVEAAPVEAAPAAPLTRFARLRKAYDSSAPYHGVLAFLVGFTYDSLTLRRIDQRFDNLSLLAYLLALGLLLVVERRVAHGWIRAPWLVRRHAWLVWGSQFFFGGLFSAYVIFYFKSASLGPSLLFTLVMAALMLVNEFYDHLHRTEGMRLALYYLCAFSFLLFFIPVMSGFPGPGIFPMSGLLAFGLTALVAAGIYRAAPAAPPVAEAPAPEAPAPEAPAAEAEAPPTPAPAPPSLSRALLRNGAVWAGLFVLLGLLNLLGVIPPVPLALMDRGVFHQVERTRDGYALTYQKPPWYLPFREDDRVFFRADGDRVWCFSAIFAPTGMGLGVYHQWQQQDPETGDWLDRDRIAFDIKGGRDNGYRGYTAKRNVSPGAWRVLVETEDGRVLGRTSFEVRDLSAEQAAERVLVTRMAE